MTTEEEIRNIHDRFYDALNKTINGNSAPMADVWHHDETVTTTHPMGHWAVGWEQVWATWDTLAETIKDGKVTVSVLRITVHGDMAYTVGVEHVSFCVIATDKRAEFDANVTNIYLRRDDEWKIAHHHPDKSSEAEDATQG